MKTTKRLPNHFFSAGVLLGAGFATLGLSAGATAEDDPKGYDLARGKAVYEHWCSHCHDGGRGMPGTQSLQIKYDGELPAVLLEREDLTADAIKTFVRKGVLSMTPFRKTEITEGELEDLAAYMTQ